MKRLKKYFSRSRLITDSRGLTLTEIIIVLVILSIVMAWLASKIFKAGDSAKAQLTNLKMQDIKQNIYIYQMRNNAFPQDLKQAGIDDTTDGWGNPLQYKLTEGGRAYEIKSPGGDGKDGGTDDISLKGP